MNKNIFIYWNTGFENAPSVVKTCLSLWEKNKSDYTLHKITDKNISYYLDIKSISKEYNFDKLTIQAKSDVIRLELLYNHGGIWTDATVLCLKNIDWLKVDHSNKNFFYSHTTPGYMTMCFLVSCEKSDIIYKWKEGVKKLIATNGESIPKTFHTEPNNKGDMFEIFQPELKVNDLDIEYFFMQRVFRYLKANDENFRNALESNFSSWTPSNVISSKWDAPNLQDGFKLLYDIENIGYSKMNLPLSENVKEVFSSRTLQKLNWRAYQNEFNKSDGSCWNYLNNEHINKYK